MIVSITPLGLSPTIVAPIPTLIAQLARQVAALMADVTPTNLVQMALDVSALVASATPQWIASAPSPIVSPGLFCVTTAGLTIPLGTPSAWNGGTVTIKDLTGSQTPNLAITGRIDLQSGAAINVAGESLTFAFDSINQTWVTI